MLLGLGLCSVGVQVAEGLHRSVSDGWFDPWVCPTDPGGLTLFAFGFRAVSSIDR